MIDPKLEDRKNKFQKGSLGLVEARENYKLSLRKQKIDAMITQKRERVSQSSENTLEINPNILNIPDDYKSKDFQSDGDFLDFVKTAFESSSLDEIKFGLFLLRTYFSVNKKPKIESGMILKMNKLMHQYIEDPSIVYEILWSMTNITITDDEEIISFFIEPSYIQNYLAIFSRYAENSNIKAQLIWLLGNMVSKNPTVRNILVKYQIFEIIYNNLQKQIINGEEAKISVWFMSSVATTFPIPDLDTMEKIQEIFFLFIKTKEEDIIADCLWGLSHISETDFENIVNNFFNPGIIDYILDLNYTKGSFVIPVIRIIGNLLSNGPDVVDNLINLGAINFLDRFIFHQVSAIKKEVLWALSNIAAGTKSQILALIKNGILTKVYLLARDSDTDIVAEAVWVIGNCINGGDFEVCLKLLETKVIDTLLEVLSVNRNPGILKIVLCTFEQLFNKKTNPSFNKGFNPFLKMFIHRGGKELLEGLQFHKNEDVFAVTTKILDDFFSTNPVKDSIE